ILLKTLAKYNDETLAEIKRTRNCHFINYGTKTKIIKLFSQYARKSEVKLLVSQSDLYQLSIPNTEIRLIGALQPNYFHAKEKVYNDLFSVLFIDFDHSLHKNIGKLKAKR
ncbi:2235_t:CDS:1, partial [Racocetra persica]